MTSAQRQSAEPRGGGATRWILPTLLAVGVAALWIWTAGETPRALRALPDVQRRPLYERTLQNFQTLCGRYGPARECQQQADFLLDFPECDDACRRAVSFWLQQPAR